jgi:hypothetical protein
VDIPTRTFLLVLVVAFLGWLGHFLLQRRLGWDDAGRSLAHGLAALWVILLLLGSLAVSGRIFSVPTHSSDDANTSLLLWMLYASGAALVALCGWISSVRGVAHGVWGAGGPDTERRFSAWVGIVVSVVGFIMTTVAGLGLGLFFVVIIGASLDD